MAHYGEMNFALLFALQEGMCRARCKASRAINLGVMLWKIALADFWLTLACTFLARQDPWVESLFSQIEHLPAFKEFATAIKAPAINVGGFAIALTVLIFSRVTRFHDRISDFFKIRARFDRANILLPLAVMSGVHMTARQIQNLKRDRHPLMRATFYKYASSRSEKPLVDKHDIESTRTAVQQLIAAVQRQRLCFDRATSRAERRKPMTCFIIRATMSRSSTSRAGRGLVPRHL